jgi:hypothetical protein
LLSNTIHMIDPDDFGPLLRRERENRGISIDALAEATKVGVDLWKGLESNDFSLWPTGIFARAFVREYARVVGLDGDLVVDDFCRHFAVGDRRAARIVRAQAELIGHQPEGLDQDPLPAGRERRRPRQAEAAATQHRTIYAPRLIAAAVDAALAGGVALGGTAFGAGFLASLGVTALLYFTAATVAIGATPGTRLLEAIRHRAPSLFADRRAVNA